MPCFGRLLKRFPPQRLAVLGLVSSTLAYACRGAVNSLNSLMAVVAPVLGAALLGIVSHLPQGDWRIGAPLHFCAALQAAALVLAVLHFRQHAAAGKG